MNEACVVRLAARKGCCGNGCKHVFARRTCCSSTSSSNVVMQIAQCKSQGPHISLLWLTPRRRTLLSDRSRDIDDS